MITFIVNALCLRSNQEKKTQALLSFFASPPTCKRSPHYTLRLSYLWGQRFVSLPFTVVSITVPCTWSRWHVGNIWRRKPCPLFHLTVLLLTFPFSSLFLILCHLFWYIFLVITFISRCFNLLNPFTELSIIISLFISFYNFSWLFCFF